ncbi:MAG: hypothetical protein DRO12_01175 [Thermoprotei archaeon]|nr:MAG: hypothetical protein DRO12_01175 [Thermoprotei archaeon]
MSGEYICDEPPCIHVVSDEERRIYAVFVEDWDGNILPVPSRELEKAIKKLSELIKRGFREASANDLSYLAKRYLEAEPVEE